MTPSLSRRAAILGLTAIASGPATSLAVGAAPTDRRFVTVILRGAMDGLSAVVPYGDPGLMALRPRLTPPMPGRENGLLDLGGMFGLHPALSYLHQMYKRGDMLAVHAVSAGYRVRSHFEAQDYLESGTDHRLTNGWLHRAAAAVRPASAGPAAIAIGPSVSLLLRGQPPAANWAPHAFSEPDPGLYQSILNLHRADPITGPSIAAGLRDRGFASGVMGGEAASGKGRFAFPALARAAGELLRAPNGPRIAALELGGWDTHSGQVNRIVAPLTQLDQGLEALRAALGETWARTAVLVMTEFGRTARMNGTNGTDHGTATVAFVAGGAVAGGRVIANWPGLGRGQLLEDRDLAPAEDLRAVAKGLLSAHLGLDAAALNHVFPASQAIQTMRGLTRAA